MASKPSSSKRRNRAVHVSDMIGGALDPVLKKRGFASRDLVSNWPVIAPAPYNRVAMPDRLAWPRRGQPGAEGATLYLRCKEGHALALAHESGAIAAAVNRYYGYFLVDTIRLSPAPFSLGSGKKPHDVPTPTATTRASVEAAVGGVEDPALREALRRLGHGILGRKG